MQVPRRQKQANAKPPTPAAAACCRPPAAARPPALLSATDRRSRNQNKNHMNSILRMNLFINKLKAEPGTRSTTPKCPTYPSVPSGPMVPFATPLDPGSQNVLAIVHVTSFLSNSCISIVFRTCVIVTSSVSVFEPPVLVITGP